MQISMKDYPTLEQRQQVAAKHGFCVFVGGSGTQKIMALADRRAKPGNKSRTPGERSKEIIKNASVRSWWQARIKEGHESILAWWQRR
jgi:hypothetical protein